MHTKLNIQALPGLARFLRSWLWLAGAIAAVVLIFVHMFWASQVEIDAVTVALLAVILMSPYLPLMRRFRIGEFEAEIGPREVEEVRDKVREAPPPQSPAPLLEPQTGYIRHVEKIDDQLRRAIDSDPALALAKLRIEIERILNDMLAIMPNADQLRSRPTGVASLLSVLSHLGAIDQPTSDAVRAITRVLNDAVHGARIHRDEAVEVIESGIRLLNRLNDVYLEAYEKAFTPIEEQTLDLKDHDAAQATLYKVTTIIPVLPNPKKRSYVMTQAQLDSFLEGYEEYAEYLVSIEPLDHSGERERVQNA